MFEMHIEATCEATMHILIMHLSGVLEYWQAKWSSSIDHFRVPLNLSFKAALTAKFLLS